MQKTILIMVCLLTLPAAQGSILPTERFEQKLYFKNILSHERAKQTAEGYFLACKTGLLIGGFYETGPTATQYLHGAITDCYKATQLDPTHYDARLSLAISLAYEGKRLSKPAFPKAAKAMMEGLIEEFPDRPVAYGAFATWHSSVSNAGWLARVALGGSRKKADHYYALAREKGVEDIGLLLEEAKYLAYGKKKERIKAEELTKTILAIPPKTRIDELFLARAEKLYAALQTEDQGHLHSVLHNITAFSDIKNDGHLPPYNLESLELTP